MNPEMIDEANKVAKGMRENVEGFSLEDALKSVLITTQAEREKWEAVDLGDEGEIRRTLSFQIGPSGRSSSRMGICKIAVKPTLAFWFGSYGGQGKPQLEGVELVAKIREVLKPAEPAGADKLAADDFAATLDALNGPAKTDLTQLSLFDYSQLADEDAIVVKTATAEIQMRMGSIQANTVEIGRRLREVKQRIEPGHFQEWLDKEFGFSRDSADRWIQVADFVDKTPQIAEALKQKLFARTAVYLLAAPSTPESAREEVIARATAGEAMPPEKVKETVKRHKVAAGSSKPVRPKVTRPAPVKREAESVTDHVPPSAIVGVCSSCRCTETTPCLVMGEPCAWTDGNQTLCTACDDLTESAWLRSTITVMIQLFPHDGNDRGRHVQVMVRNDQDQPIQRFVRSLELSAFEGPVGETLEKLKAELPERWRRQLATKRAEADKAAADAERAKKAKAKTKTSKPAKRSARSQGPKRKPAAKSKPAPKKGGKKR